jgi:Fic family protein
MRIPKAPPKISDLLDGLKEDPSKLITIITQATEHVVTDAYIPWDKLRYKTPPSGLTSEQWWLGVRMARQAFQRVLPITDDNGKPFTYALTDEILRKVEWINRDASGYIGISEQVTNSATRDRYIVNSLIEEAITSSQLEGAATTRQVAKEMIRTGRRPRTRDEQMILNNYRGMQRIREVQDESLTPELILEIHRILTADTLDNPEAAGRFQRPGDVRVGVYSVENDLLHTPPPAEQIEGGMQRICDFANRKLDTSYIPPVLRAIVVHFALAYLHPFEDGNGRTSRTMFYWSMLNQGYWLAEFISISRILKGAPAKYARSFLYSEQDGGDLTYFITFQMDVISRAIKDLHDYLTRKIGELKDLQRSLATMPGEFNHRQLALIEHAIKNPAAQYSALSHSTSHNVARETARQDLTQLQERGVLVRRKMGKSFIWIPVPDITGHLLGPDFKPNVPG